MNVVPSTLHPVKNYVYKNKVYTLKTDPKHEIFLSTKKEGQNPLEVLEQEEKGGSHKGRRTCKEN